MNLEYEWTEIDPPIGGDEFTRRHPGFVGLVRIMTESGPDVMVVGDVDSSLEWGDGYGMSGSVGAVHAFAPFDVPGRHPREQMGVSDE